MQQSMTEGGSIFEMHTLHRISIGLQLNEIESILKRQIGKNVMLSATLIFVDNRLHRGQNTSERSGDQRCDYTGATL